MHVNFHLDSKKKKTKQKKNSEERFSGFCMKF